MPSTPRKRSIEKAVAFVRERLNGEDGLGAIYPAMANSVMMFDVLGYPKDHPDVVSARNSIEKLLACWLTSRTGKGTRRDPWLAPLEDPREPCSARTRKVHPRTHRWTDGR